MKSTVCPTPQFVPDRNAGEVVGTLLPVLQALADPSRLHILIMLREGEQCVCRLTEVLGLSQGTVSHHMAVLKRVGLVRDRRDNSDARWIHYALTPAAGDVGRLLADLLDGYPLDSMPANCRE